MIVLVKLIFAHLIGDFLLQPKSWVVEKEKKKAKSPKLYLHILTHGLLTLLFLWSFDNWLLVFLLMIIHGTIDILKLYAQKKNNKSLWFFIDQGLHIASILVLWFLFFKPEINCIQWFENPNIWIYTTAILFLTIVCGIVMRELMANWSKEINDNNKESLNNAGKYIGMLERLFVFIFVVAGRWEGIGFLLAAKSVFRFGDLKKSKDRKLTEYILIGTLLSFGIAIIIAMLVFHLTNN